jgi:hypothetical protein
MKELRKKFEKETGMVAHHQGEDDIDTQFSYEYTEWLEDERCINSDKKIGECIERCIVSRIKAGEDVKQVFDDYGIKIKQKQPESYGPVNFDDGQEG